ncbi:hypothetical protein [Streptomyces althioticus]
MDTVVVNTSLTAAGSANSLPIPDVAAQKLMHSKRGSMRDGKKMVRYT